MLGGGKMHVATNMTGGGINMSYNIDLLHFLCYIQHPGLYVWGTLAVPISCMHREFFLENISSKNAH